MLTLVNSSIARGVNITQDCSLAKLGENGDHLDMMMKWGN